MDPLEDVIILNIVKYAIALVGIIGAGFHFARYTQIKGTGREWITFGFGVILTYWSFYYLRSSIGLDLGMTHQIWVRIGIFLTVCLITDCGIEAWWRGRKRGSNE